ncbi:Putative H/ACA ribonucleoprotein complex subunit 1-like protein 1 [Zea mays]|uniref:H/ACA ribonucleoprotein complex subunit n=1 Tax=Zea mays TaxID=4577 RepID=A0A1D6LQ26_MAIZE|nr:Putative H/ACA ribonucleoprotein complex subunit 1-like protein 1 [Zea mays]
MAWGEDEAIDPDVASMGLHVSERIGRDAVSSPPPRPSSASSSANSPRAQKHTARHVTTERARRWWPVSTFLHACEGEAMTKLTNEKVPYFNVPIYLQNKTQIGKVEEIFGPINESMSTSSPP